MVFSMPSYTPSHSSSSSLTSSLSSMDMMESDEDVVAVLGTEQGAQIIVDADGN